MSAIDWKLDWPTPPRTAQAPTRFVEPVALMTAPPRSYATDEQIKKWINESYEKVCKASWINLSTGILSEPMPSVPASPPATPPLGTDHAWDMVVLAARASRYES